MRTAFPTWQVQGLGASFIMKRILITFLAFSTKFLEFLLLLRNVLGADMHNLRFDAILLREWHNLA